MIFCTLFRIQLALNDSIIIRNFKKLFIGKILYINWNSIHQKLPIEIIQNITILENTIRVSILYYNIGGLLLICCPIFAQKYNKVVFY